MTGFSQSQLSRIQTIRTLLISAILFKISLENATAHIIGVFIARGKEDALVTLNMVPGETVYGEKKIVVEVSIKKKQILPLVIQKFGVYKMNDLWKIKPVNFYINQLQLCYSSLLTCVQFYTKVQQ